MCYIAKVVSIAILAPYFGKLAVVKYGSAKNKIQYNHI